MYTTNSSCTGLACVRSLFLHGYMYVPAHHRSTRNATVRQHSSDSRKGIVHKVSGVLWVAFALPCEAYSSLGCVALYSTQAYSFLRNAMHSFTTMKHY